MSLVTVVCIRGRELYIGSMHWREVKDIVNSQQCNNIGRKLDLDAGYVLLDFNNAFYINCQRATGLAMKGWRGMDL